jgi:hypothetical protein
MTQIYLALIFFLAGIVPELTGFGVATISMAFLSFILPLTIAIPLVAIISVIATGIVAFQTKTSGIIKYVLPLFVGSVVGVLLGMIFLNLISEDILKLSLGIFLVFYAFFGIFLKGHFLPMGKVGGGVVGLIAGFFGASFNIHGPLVGLYSSSSNNLSKNQTKDLIATYMFATGILTVAGHTIFGRINGEVLLRVIFALPFILAGLAVGKRIFKKISIIWVKRGVYAFVLVAGIVLLF